MHAVDMVFAQRDSDMMHHKEAISEKKLDKGDGGWNQQKEILGWILDSKWQTLELMDWCVKQIMDIFKDLQGQNCMGVKKWQ